MTEDKIIDRIRKLLALAEGKGATAEEAENAFSKAQALMAKHAIEEAIVRASGQKVADEPIINHKIHVRARDEIKRAKLTLLNRIAKANNCKIVDATDYCDQVWIVGHESDAMFVEILSSAVLMQYASERTREWKRYQQENPFSSLSRFKWLQGFSYGYAVRIGERLTAETQASVDEAEAGAPGTALVLRDKFGAVEAWMSSNLATRETRARSFSVNSHAAGQGAAAANKADLSGGRNNVRGGGGAKGIGS